MMRIYEQTGLNTTPCFAAMLAGRVKIKKLENVAIAGHCNLTPPGLPPDPPWRTLAENCHARKLHLVLSKCV